MSGSTLFQLIERSVEYYANERSQQKGSSRPALTFPIIHTCMKEIEPRLQLFRNIVRENACVVEKMFNFAPGHPLASEREMVCSSYKFI